MNIEPMFTDYDINDAGEKMLPTYCGYTVDVDGRAFYRILDDDLEYISFESHEGGLMLFELRILLPRDSRLYKRLAELKLMGDVVRHAREMVV
jgi:hypothetical protein